MDTSIFERRISTPVSNSIEISSAAQLFHMMQYPGNPKVTIKGKTGILQSVQREDGSGKSFNVQLDYQWIHVRF